MSARKIFTAIFFTAIFVFFTYQLGGDGDFFHHVNTGRHVVTTKSFPYTDDLTFTASGRPWVGYAWGMGVLFYLVYSNFGAVGISLTVAALAVFTFVLLYFLLRKIGAGYWTSMITLALAAGPISTRWPNRPEIITYPFVISFLLIDLLRTNYPRLIWLLPILTLFWANLYGSSTFIGLGLVLMFAGKQCVVDKFKFVPRERLLYLASLTTFLTAFINPYGLRAIFYIFLIPAVAKVQGEWAGVFETLSKAPLEYLLVFQYRAFIYFLFLAIVLIVCIFSCKKILRHPFWALLALAVFVPMFLFRHLPLAVILTLPAIALCIENSTKIKKYFFTILIILVSLLSWTISWWINQPGVGITDLQPYRAVEFIKKHKLSGNVFNNQQIGAFLSYYLSPGVKVFFDTRDDLFLNTPVYSDILSMQTNPLGIIGKYPIDFLVLDLSESPALQALFYSDTWLPVYLTDTIVIAVSPQTVKEKNLQVLDAVDPFSPSNAKPNTIENAYAQYTELANDQKDSYNIQLRLGRTLLIMERFDDSIKVLQGVPLPRGPLRDLLAVDKYYLLAQAYLSTNQCSLSKYYLDKTKTSSEGKIIFAPDKGLSESLNKGYAFYYLVCQKNEKVAREFLDKYLSRSDVNLSEKKQTTEQFNTLSPP
jgi:hypothetical protein